MYRRNAEGKPTEYFDFMAYTWNIDRARELIAKRKRNKKPIPVNVEEIYNSIRWGGILGVRVDEEYALTQADLSKPLIFGLIKLPGEKGKKAEWFRLLIDGHHRLYRAMHEGIETLPSYDLTKKENHLAAEGMMRPPPRRNPERTYTGVVFGEEEIQFSAAGSYEALKKAAIHFNVDYILSNIKQETTAIGGLPMLSVKTTDGRWLQVWWGS